MIQNMKTLLRIAKEARGHKIYMVTAALCTLVLTGLSLLGPRIQTKVLSLVESGLTEEKIHTVVGLCIWLLVVYILRGFLRLAGNVIAHKASWEIVTNIRMQVYRRIQSFSAGYFSKAKTGDLMSRCVGDVATFEQLYAHIIPDGIANVVTFVGVAVILFTQNAKLALLTCLPLPFIVLSSGWMMKAITPWFRRIQDSLSGMNIALQDSFTGIQEVRAFGQEERQAQRVQKEVDAYSYAMVQSVYAGALFHPFVELLTALGPVIILLFGGLIAYRGGIELSGIMGFLLYVSLFFAPITGLTQLLEQAQQALAGAERVLEILDTPVEIQNAENPVIPDAIRGDICFENVNFGYSEDKRVLEHVSFHAAPGSFLAIVGPTGAGKTTAVKLAARLYDPDGGRVLLDGCDLRQLQLESLRRAVAYVPQDTFLFNCSIAENIAFGRPEASREEIIAAAKIARIHDDIMEMPEGYDSPVGERGVRLSGGQKQRLAIARAVICGAPVLILDEATSSVDAETERLIQKSIDELAGSRTIIAIAHRLSTIKNADCILVMENGHIVQQGSHEQLMADAEGRYARMYRLQTEKDRLLAEELALGMRELEEGE